MRKGGLYLVLSDSVGWTIPAYTGETGKDLYGHRVWDTINKLYEPINHINKGIGGTRAYKMVENINWLATLEPDIVTIGVGMNDSTSSVVDTVAYQKNVSFVIDRLRVQNPDVQIILCAPNTSTDPNRSSLPEYRQALKELAEAKGVDYVDFSAAWDQASSAVYTGDGVHPNPEGQRLLFELLFPVIKNGPFVQSLAKRQYDLPSSNLVGEYRFDEGAGTTVTDYSGANDGNFAGTSPQWTEQGLALTGDDVVSLPLSFDPNNDFTLHFVLKLGAIPEIDQRIWSMGSSSSNQPYMELVYKSADEVTFQSRNDAGLTSATSTRLIGVKKDQHLIFELKRKGSDITLSELVTGQSITRTIEGTYTVNKQTLGALGRITNSLFLNNTLNFNMVYSRAINSAESMQVKDYIKSKVVDKDILIQ